MHIELLPPDRYFLRTSNSEFGESRDGTEADFFMTIRVREKYDTLCSHMETLSGGLMKRAGMIPPSLPLDKR